MVGERWETWRETVARTVDLGPDSVTVYQLELPYNSRHLPAEPLVLGTIDLPHAAGPELGGDPELGEPATDQQA